MSSLSEYIAKHFTAGQYTEQKKFFDWLAKWGGRQVSIPKGRDLPGMGGLYGPHLVSAYGAEYDRLVLSNPQMVSTLSKDWAKNEDAFVFPGGLHGNYLNQASENYTLLEIPGSPRGGDYPHTCPACGSDAFLGFASIACKGYHCAHYEKKGPYRGGPR